MANREDEKKKRAEDPEDEGGLDTSTDRAEEDEETASEETDKPEQSDDSEDSDESEEDSSDDNDDDDADDEEEEEKAAASDDAEEQDDAEEEEDEEPRKSDTADESEPGDMAAAGEAKDEEDDAPAAQLGTQRYVLSAFFGAALVFAYLLGRAIDGIWLKLATRDWLVERVPVVAAVPDDDKAMYATIAGGVIALVVAIRTSRKPDVKQWSDDVSSELLKVKWPTRKEVYASTVVVLTTSAVAVVYLFLLDRFWGFVTNQIYGTGL